MFEKMHLIQTPSGRWSFVGKVHEKLSDKSFASERAALLAAKFAEERFGALPVTQIIRNN